MSSLFKKKKRSLDQIKRSSAIKSDLVKIYRDKDGKMPDISKLEVKKRSILKPVLISLTIITVLLAAISWLGFLIFGSGNGYRGKSLDIEIKVENNVASGDKVTYTISYKNKEKGALNNLELFLRYPEGFTFLSATPTPSNEFNSLWQLGNLPKNGKGEVEISGKLIGEVGSIKTTDITFSFEPENFASTFKETTSFSQQIASSILEIEVEGPKETLPKKKVTYTVKYKNSSDQALENVQLQILYPLNFVFQSAEPEPYQGEEEEIARKLNNIWRFKELESLAEGEIIIEGGYVVDEEEKKDFIVQIGFLDQDSNFQLQQEQKITTKIVKQNLSLDLIINGSNTDQPVNFGETLNYLIAYKNLGQTNLEDITLEVNINSDLIDWETLEGENLGEIDQDNNLIIWDKEEVEEFKTLEPLSEGQIEFSLKLKDFSDINADNIDFETNSLVRARIAKVDDLEADLEIESNSIVNIINTELQLKVEGRYFNDDNIAVGTGPLPPVVGQTTTFRIYWAIANSLNEVSKVEVSTTLPQGVEFAEKFMVNAGKLNYSPDDKTITWQVSKISSNKTFDDVNVWFDVSVIPTTEQKGKILVLTTQTNLKAIDLKTEDEITKTASAITSNLEHDPIAKGKGIVVGID